MPPLRSIVSTAASALSAVVLSASTISTTPSLMREYVKVTAKSSIAGVSSAVNWYRLRAWSRILEVCGGVFNAKQQMIGIVVYVQDMSSLRILESGMPTAEIPPVDSIRDLARLSAGTTSGHRVKLRGIVTLQRPFSALYLKDATESLEVETFQPTSVQPGDVLEVWGFPAVAEGSRKLEDAEFRKLTRGPPPRPDDISLEEALQGNFDSSLVRLQGRLFRAITVGNPPPSLLVVSGRVAFRAQVLGDGANEALSRLQIGSRVRITGVCEMLPDEKGALPAFRLLVRSPTTWTCWIKLRGGTLSGCGKF